MQPNGALSDVKVVELSSYVSGPFCGMLLADFGAQVVKIEPPETGDPFRGWGSVDNPFFQSVNRNKRSVTLDLKSEAGLAAARRLIEGCDVLIENYRTGTLDGIGLAYDQLKTANPRLIYCSITGFGNVGPYARRPGYDTVGQAMAGLLGLLTDFDNPQPMGVSISDHLAGMIAFDGIMAALYARTRTGRGQRVDTSLLEATVSFIGENATRYLKERAVPTRATRTRTAQVFAFVDEAGKPFALHLSSPTKFWTGLLQAIGRPEWKDDRFRDRRARIKNYDVLRSELAAIFRTGKRETWLQRLGEQDVPSCPINTLEELFDDPQVDALGIVVEAPGCDGQPVKLIRNGARLSETPPFIARGAPDLGEHNAEVLDPLMQARSGRACA
jgi:crotonobetainyl-CoA:carnitine CoA-transferase CaiB-like acyl-CoA transferase